MKSFLEIPLGLPLKIFPEIFGISGIFLYLCSVENQKKNWRVEPESDLTDLTNLPHFS